MLRLPPFKYHIPKSIAEAVELKVKHGDNAVYTAGGTDLYPNMKRRQITPQNLIGLRELQELQIVSFEEGLTIGSGVSISEVAEDPRIKKNYPALAKAAASVSSPQLRKMGTIGGNLCLDTRCNYYNQTFQWRKALGFCMKKDGEICWVARSSPICLAVSSSDCAPVAVALNVEFSLLGPKGERNVPAGQFYENDGVNYLKKKEDELLVSIHIPPSKGWRMNYKKLRRRGSIDFPVLSVAIVLSIDETKVCRKARIVLGSVASCPIRAFESEKILIGEILSVKLIEESAKAAAKLAKPMDNTDMGLGFRKKMVPLFVADAIKEALEN